MLVGRGIADITGESAGAGMLGYGKAEQRTAGIQMRLRARAFVFDDAGARVALVVAELPLPMQSVTDEVLTRLRARHGERYTARNTLITVTHTHSGPGGYCGHLLYNLTTGGFRPATFEAIVAGIVEAVDAADADLAPARVRVARGELHDASVNRAPAAFARNPAADRAVFPAGIDPATTLLRIDRAGTPVGAVNFFATHGTSMTNRNRLISSDNKGYAAYHWERLVAGGDYLAGPLDFIAAFAQTNTADMSPNVDAHNNIGPTGDEQENTRIIGLRQYAAAAALPEGVPLGTGVDTRVTRVDLSAITVEPRFTPDGRPHRTGRPMMAAAALAGTCDGRGFPGFHEGRNRLVDAVSALLYRCAPRLRDAHAPRGLVAPAGPLNRVTPFVQERVPVQLLRIGRLYLIGIPGEATIIAGLRLRRVVAEIVGAELADVLCVGYANAYIHYITTPEEYTAQRYEGGSTIFGRWELPALMQTVAGLATALRDGTPAAPAAPAAALARLRWAPRPLPDPADCGTVLTQPGTEYRPGQTVRAVFATADPDNDVRRGGTFLEVQRHDEHVWVRIADDGDWSTRLRWRRTGLRGRRAVIDWTIPDDAVPGRYRIVHRGAARRRGGRLAEFTGLTHAFTVAGATAGPRP